MSIFDIQAKNRREWIETVAVGRGQINFKIDTGSGVDAARDDEIKKCGYGRHDFNPSKTLIITYSRHVIQPIGVLQVTGKMKSNCFQLEIKVLDKCPTAILGLHTAEVAGLV